MIIKFDLAYVMSSSPTKMKSNRVWFRHCNIGLSDCDEVESKDSRDHDELIYEG